MAVALEVLGSDPARPYVEFANATYTNLVDRENLLADLLGLRVVPNIHLMDEAGIFRGEVADEAAVTEWIETSGTPESVSSESGVEDAAGRIKALSVLTDWMPGNARLQLELADAYRATGCVAEAESAYMAAIYAGESALIHFRLSGMLLEQGRRDAGIAHLRRAARLEPENYVIRKQAWAVESPESFYSGAVDYEWQREQMAREASER